MPPKAPAIGRVTCAGRDSSPATTSRLISMPTSRKNTTIRPSSIQCTSDSGPSFRCRTCATAPPSGELASANASTAAASNGTALPASLCRKANQRFIGPRIRQNARVFRPGRLPSQVVTGLVAALSHEAHQELEQVHEVEVEAERPENRDLLGHLGAPGVGILLLDLLGVVGDEAREDQHARDRDDEGH